MLDAQSHWFEVRPHACHSFTSSRLLEHLDTSSWITCLLELSSWDALYMHAYHKPWWRHQMETLSALLVLCVGNSPVTGEFPSQSPVTRNCDVFFDLRPNKRLSKQSRRRWFEMVSRSLWRPGNAVNKLTCMNPYRCVLIFPHNLNGLLYDCVFCANLDISFV